MLEVDHHVDAVFFEPIDHRTRGLFVEEAVAVRRRVHARREDPELFRWLIPRSKDAERDH